MCPTCTSWNLVDILLVLVVLLSLLTGIRQGFILITINLFTWVVAVLLALCFYQPVADWLGQRVGSS